MHRHFIVAKSFGHQIDCFCPDGEHADYIVLNKADVIEITNERKNMMDYGWYFMIIINHHRQFYIALEDLDKYFVEGRMMSLFDLELRIIYLNYQIDKALDKGDEPSFLAETKKLKEASILQTHLQRFLHNVEENQIIYE
ncbi:MULTISPECIES: hypothetical protein [Bacillaceae]|uniref:IDEAL domain-containing protein n=1 Tax=Domibacillus aminovorans TaxID=29332 RepID=A0A177KMW4_9BACI|nr:MULTISPECIES: hypothetical protein [Bacillaceae]OAH54326.1 hypothetical protein AWH48_06900 [Domibacillus aminovorans]